MCKQPANQSKPNTGKRSIASGAYIHTVDSTISGISLAGKKINHFFQRQKKKLDFEIHYRYMTS